MLFRYSRILNGWFSKRCGALGSECHKQKKAQKHATETFEAFKLSLEVASNVLIHSEPNLLGKKSLRLYESAWLSTIELAVNTPPLTEFRRLFFGPFFDWISAIRRLFYWLSVSTIYICVMIRCQQFLRLFYWLSIRQFFTFYSNFFSPAAPDTELQNHVFSEHFRLNTPLNYDFFRACCGLEFSTIFY